MSACPACGEPLFGWLLVELDGHGSPKDSVVLERCERCRLGAAADLAPADSASALLDSARQIPDGRLELRVANRASVQASLGGNHWAALEPKRRLYPTPQSLPAAGRSRGPRDRGAAASGAEVRGRRGCGRRS